MFRNPGWFIGILLILIVCAVGYRYEQYVFAGNFTVDGRLACDATTQRCFVADCSPKVDSTCDVSPYKKIKLPANKAPACLMENTCEAFVCDATTGCSTIYCSADALGEGEVCAPTPN